MTDRDALEDIRNTLALYREGRLSLPDALEDLETILDAARKRRGPSARRPLSRA